MTTADITTFLFPDTYLFGSQCCVLFHNFDLEPGDARTASANAGT
jgi:hypothetical protein